MIPQLGFSEILVIAILALVVVGPKDLPKLMRTVGHFVGRIKRLGAEFKDAFEQMGAEDEMAELRKEIDELKSLAGDQSISDKAFEDEMRALDRDLRDSVKPTPVKESLAKTESGETTGE